MKTSLLGRAFGIWICAVWKGEMTGKVPGFATVGPTDLFLEETCQINLCELLGKCIPCVLYMHGTGRQESRNVCDKLCQLVVQSQSCCDNIIWITGLCAVSLIHKGKVLLIKKYT